MKLYFPLPLLSTTYSFVVKSILVSLLFMAVFSATKAQTRPESSKIGKIAGRIIDATTSQPMEFVTVALWNRRDSTVITGTVTDEKGIFVLNEVPAGAFRVKISFMGYRTAVKDSLLINPGTPERDLGVIKLNPSVQNLKEVVITGQQEVFQQSIDKRVFNVTQNIVSNGGSATDVLETIPSVALDSDGNINLRGSGGVIVLIDGKPSGLTGANRAAILEQIPASAIENIEIITNPSAKYDAEGMAGIINITLKKNKLQGSNGIATVSVGTRDKYNGSLNLNYRTPKFNIFTNYSFRYSSTFMRSSTFRHTFSETDTSFLDQNERGQDRDRVHMIRAGLDYYLNERNTIGFSAMYNKDNETEPSILTYRYLDANRNLTNLSYQSNLGTEDGTNLDLNLNYRKTFKAAGRELTASATYSESNGDNRESMDFMDDTFVEGSGRRWNTATDLKNSIVTLQSDYVHPVNKDVKIETGYKSIIRRIDNNFVYQNYVPSEEAWQINTARSNHFEYNEQVHSLYGNYSQTIKNFGYQLGTRLEQTLTRSIQKTTGEAPFDRNYLSFFPSVFISYKLKKEQQVQLNYSRRINRPGMRELNPFVDYSDSLNIQSGNPQLKPEYTNAFELSYLKGWKSFFLTSSVFYRRTDDIIQRFITVDPSNIASTTFQNINNRDQYGLEFIGKATFTSWWNVTTTYNFFRSVINGSNINSTFTNDNISWSLSLMSNMSIPKIAQIQVFGNYRGPMPTAQGIMKEMYGINVGVRRDVLKNKGTVSLNVNDIFNTRQFNMEVNGETYNQESSRKRESRIATLTFTYKFGKFQDTDKADRKGRNRNEQGQDQQGGGEDFF